MYSPFPITRSFVVVIVVFGFVFLQLIETTLGDFRTGILFFNCSSSESGLGGSLVPNFGLVMANLSALVNENGFAMVDLKTGSLHGFALSQCFGDLNSTDCSLCFSEIRSTLPRCYPKVGGRLFFDGCFGRYESYNFFDQYVDSIHSTICSSEKSSFQSLEFLSALNKTLGRVQSSAPSSGGFSVYTHTYSNNITVSALGQCWRNLDRKSCSACLLTAASSIVSCSPALEGRSLYAGCYLRYSDRVFWDLQHLDDSSGVNKIIWILIAVCSGGFLFATAIFIRLFRKQRCRLVELCFKGFSAMELPPAIAFSKLNFKYNVLRKATDDFNLSNKLGQGSNGSVYKGVLRNGREVAVKRLFLNTRQWVAQFFNEVDLISQVHHKNLVKLLGCSLDGPESLLVYEYYFNKSLDFFIFDADPGKILDWKSRVEIIQGVAEGLCHLHEESEVRVVHRDIKASNILLDDFLKPKITDFGLARSFSQDQTHLTTGLAGTLGYMAPEYILHGHLTEKADVYSFGVLLLEIVTGKRCSGDFGMIPGESLVSKVWKEYKRNTEMKVTKKTVEIIDDRIVVEDGDEEEFWRMVHIGLLCTQTAPGNRPSMRKVVEFIRRSGVGEGGEEGVPTQPPFLDVLLDVRAEGVEDCPPSASTSSAPVLPKSDSTALIYGR